MIRSRLRRLRVEAEDRQGRKLPYRTIAAETGLSYGTVSRLATGKLVRIELDTLDKLCAYFDCKVGELLEYIPNPII